MDNAQTTDVSAVSSETLVVPEDRKSILRRLIGRERALREQTRELGDELEQLVAKELEAIEAEEAHAAQILSSLQERAQALTDREQTLIDREARLRPAEHALSERERSVVSREVALEKRASELEARAANVAEAAKVYAERAAQLEQREHQVAELGAELEQRSKNVAAREVLARRLEPVRPVPQSAPSVNIDRLERLVLARRDEFPDQIVEWEAYLFELRSKASADGSLPPSLTGLVETVFAALL